MPSTAGRFLVFYTTFARAPGILINHPSTIPSLCNTFREFSCSLYLSYSDHSPLRTDFKIKIKLTIADLNHNSTTESISVDLKKKS